MTGFTISRQFTFAASHRLEGLEDGHKCARLHGHNYTVTLTLRRGNLDSRGMVLDYAEMRPFTEYLAQNLDHRHLGAGDVYDGKANLTDPAVLDFSPTAERLAYHLYGVAEQFFGHYVDSVEVRETPAVTAVYSRW